MIIAVRHKGSSKSGNYGHAGRPGKVGGSAPKSAGNVLTGNLMDQLRDMGDRNVSFKINSINKTIEMPASQAILWFQGKEPTPEEAAQFTITIPDKLELPADSGQQTVQAKYHDLESMPSYQRYKNGDPAVANELGVEDLYLKAILQDQGFNGKPDVRSKADMDAFVQNGEVELFRGLSPVVSTHRDSGGRTVLDELKGEDLTKQFKNGELFVGRGINGNGTYTSNSKTTADGYAGGGGTVMRMTLKSDAKVIGDSDIYNMRNKAREELDRAFDPVTDRYRAGKMSGEEYVQALESHYADVTKLTQSPMWNDPGRVAAVLGYDAINIGGGGVYVILNRTAVRVQDTDLEPYK